MPRARRSAAGPACQVGDEIPKKQPDPELFLTDIEGCSLRIARFTAGDVRRRTGHCPGCGVVSCAPISGQPRQSRGLSSSHRILRNRMLDHQRPLQSAARCWTGLAGQAGRISTAIRSRGLRGGPRWRGRRRWPLRGLFAGQITTYCSRNLHSLREEPRSPCMTVPNSSSEARQPFEEAVSSPAGARRGVWHWRSAAGLGADAALGGGDKSGGKSETAAASLCGPVPERAKAPEEKLRMFPPPFFRRRPQVARASGRLAVRGERQQEVSADDRVPRVLPACRDASSCRWTGFFVLLPAAKAGQLSPSWLSLPADTRASRRPGAVPDSYPSW